jgi:hypothetical protein
MTDPSCRALPALIPAAERERQPDRLADVRATSISAASVHQQLLHEHLL